VGPEADIFRTIARVLAVVAGLVVIFVTPIWAETSRGYAVLPIWWSESGATRSLILTGAVIDGVAVVAIFVSVFWPRLARR
jgi:hypothetical protein